MSGYGVRLPIILNVLDRLRHLVTSPEYTPNPYSKDTVNVLESWDDDLLRTFVRLFVEEKFPTVIALNKIDLPDASKNIDKICRKYDESRIVLTSALAENFIRRLAKQGFIHYHEGTDRFETAEDLEGEAIGTLKSMDEKTRRTSTTSQEADTVEVSSETVYFSKKVQPSENLLGKYILRSTGAIFGPRGLVE
ncbi:hypothetical protein HDU93_001491 [Gonapodya sp. JEL0774]|nr:hypothetical protein HDU93_001491 [Gonapodya sp. JEL0774]